MHPCPLLSLPSPSLWNVTQGTIIPWIYCMQTWRKHTYPPLSPCLVDQIPTRSICYLTAYLWWIKIRHRKKSHWRFGKRRPGKGWETALTPQTGKHSAAHMGRTSASQTTYNSSFQEGTVFSQPQTFGELQDQNPAGLKEESSQVRGQRGTEESPEGAQVGNKEKKKQNSYNRELEQQLEQNGNREVWRGLKKTSGHGKGGGREQDSRDRDWANTFNGDGDQLPEEDNRDDTREHPGFGHRDSDDI